MESLISSNTILIVSIMVQFMATVVAFSLVRFTPDRFAWILLAIAMLFMGIRRVFSFLQLSAGELGMFSVFQTEVIALFISALMLWGVLTFVPFLKSVDHTNSELSRFKKILDQTLDCIFMFNKDDLKFTYVNKGAIRQLGYSEKELLKMTPLDIKPDYTAEEFSKLLNPLISGQSDSLLFDTVHLTKSGNTVPVEVFLQYVNFTHEDGCFVAIVRDASTRKSVH